MATVKRREGIEVLEPVCSVIALVLVVVACVDLCDAATIVDVYRLIQYDFAGVQYGSRFAALNHHAGSVHFKPGADLSRTVVVSHIYEVNATLLRGLIAQKQQLGGLLFLLPKLFSPKEDGIRSQITKIDGHLLVDRVVELETILLQTSFLYPVYFTFENPDISAIVADVKTGDVTDEPATATTGGYKFVVPVPEPKKLSSPTVTNIQGWLPGLKVDGDANQLPTIAIVASYDTFGVVPALSSGSDSNGSGVAALLEISRLFSLLYANPKNRGRFNLLFGLTSGGPYNYNGTQKWLRSFDQRIRESIDYAICLNSIGSQENEFWIHVSKPPENVIIKQVFEGFSDVARELGVQVGLKHKKINISNPRVAWEHEQFSRFRVTAATFSGLPLPPDFLQGTGGLSDRRQFVHENAVRKGVKLVAEGIARHIYGYQRKSVEIFADNSTLSVNPFYLRSWLNLLSRTTRVSPFLSKNDAFIMSLKKELGEHTVEVNVQHEVLDGMFTFYDSTNSKLHIYRVASVTFDLLLLLAVGSYLVLLFTFLVITTRGLDDLIGLFRRPTSQKVKTT